MSAAGTDNPHVKSNNIIFTVKDGKLCPPVVTLSARNNQKLSKRFSKGFERRLLIGMNIKQKMRIKIEQMNIDIFSNQILLEPIDCLF